MLIRAHDRWRAQRQLPPGEWPGLRYVLLHTFAHVLIREFALECGYSAAGIGERVYARTGEEPMAGVLLYTAAPDSEGTLGGLVSLGQNGGWGGSLWILLPVALVAWFVIERGRSGGSTWPQASATPTVGPADTAPGPYPAPTDPSHPALVAGSDGAQLVVIIADRRALRAALDADTVSGPLGGALSPVLDDLQSELTLIAG